MKKRRNLKVRKNVKGVMGVLLSVTLLAGVVAASPAFSGIYANTPVSAAEGEPDGTKTYVYGDVDLSGKLEAVDALGILKHVVQLDTFEDGLVLELADVTHDGGITAADALAVLKCVVNLQTPDYYETTPEETGDPATSDNPDETETLDASNKPTDNPVKSDEPKTTDEPVVTDKPTDTNEPAASNDPVVSDNPDETVEPIVTESAAPLETDEPKESAAPPETTAPAQSDEPTEPTETVIPTVEPTVKPTVTPTVAPTETAKPTATPTTKPTTTPTVEPTVKPTATPTPTAKPSEQPTATPTVKPTVAPTETVVPTVTPTETPEPHTHSYVSTVVKPATCTEDGVMTLTCGCGDIITKPIPATGHNYEATYETVTVVDEEAQYNVLVPYTVWVCNCNTEFHKLYGATADDVSAHKFATMDMIAYHQSAAHKAEGYEYSYNAETRWCSCTCGWSHFGDCGSNTTYVEYHEEDIPAVTHEETTIVDTCSVCGAIEEHEYSGDPETCSHEWYVARDPWNEYSDEEHYVCACGADLGLYAGLTKADRIELLTKHKAEYEESERGNHTAAAKIITITYTHNATYRCALCGEYKTEE